VLLVAAGFSLGVTAGDVVVVKFANHHVAVGLLCPLVAGLAVPIACAGPSLRVPDPPRAKAARVVWALMWTIGVAIALSWAGNVMSRDVASSSALMRNVLLVAALSLWCSAVGLVEVAWVVPTVYAMCSLQFGGAGSWWSAFADSDATSRQMAVAVALCGVSIAAYGALSGRDAWRI
jgi:hypothetical protein